MDAINSPELLLAASLASLCTGPALIEGAVRRRSLLRLMSLLAAVVVTGLVLLTLLPEAIEVAGLAAIPLALLGLVTPLLFEQGQRALGRSATRLAWLVGAAGLVIHTLLDGAALSQTSEHHTEWGLAVVLHQLPVGLATWWILRARYGRGTSVAALIATGALLAAGFLLGPDLLRDLDRPGVASFQAFVAGFLLHVALHGAVPHPAGGVTPSGGGPSDAPTAPQ